VFQKLAITLSLPAMLTAGDIPRLEGQHGADRAEPAYLSLKPIDLPIFENGRIEGHVSAKLVIEGRSRDAVTGLGDDLPAIRSRLLTAMIEYNRLYASGLAPIDAERLSKTLNDRSITPHAGIRRILIVELSAIPI
jgi:hypothetical protein